MSAENKGAEPSVMNVLDVPISVVNMKSLTSILVGWAKENVARTVFVRDVHGLMRAVDDKQFLQLHRRADLVVPDGTPLTWIGRWRGYGDKIGRTPGADIVDEICEASQSLGYKHYFFGGMPGVAEKMVDALKAKYPDLHVVGTYSPPVRDVSFGQVMSKQELDELNQIAAAEADFVWVGISTPKQEIWMSKAVSCSDRGIFIGVGAAFDFHAGLVERAPRWMRENGLEWFHRLLSDPRRLWRRYLVLAPRFAISSLLRESKTRNMRRG